MRLDCFSRHRGGLRRAIRGTSACGDDQRYQRYRSAATRCHCTVQSVKGPTQPRLPTSWWLPLTAIALALCAFWLIRRVDRPGDRSEAIAPTAVKANPPSSGGLHSSARHQTLSQVGRAEAEAYHQRVAQESGLFMLRDRDAGTEIVDRLAVPIPQTTHQAQIGLDADYIRTQLREQMMPLMKECYEDALTRTPALAGKLAVSFTVVGAAAVGGVIEETTLDPTSTIRDPDLEECVRESFYTLQLPAPSGNGQMKVTFPLTFAAEAPTDAGTPP